MTHRKEDRFANLSTFEASTFRHLGPPLISGRRCCSSDLARLIKLASFSPLHLLIFSECSFCLSYCTASECSTERECSSVLHGKETFPRTNFSEIRDCGLDMRRRRYETIFRLRQVTAVHKTWRGAFRRAETHILDLSAPTRRRTRETRLVELKQWPRRMRHLWHMI